MGTNVYSSGAGQGQPYPTFNDFQTNTASVPWAEIFSRHEKLLSAHLELLHSVKGHVAQDGEAFRAVSSMVNKTIQSMSQFKVVKKHMLSRKPNENPFAFASSSTSPTQARQTPTPQSTDAEFTSPRKRSRTEKERDIINTEPETTLQSDLPVSKRKRDIAPRPVAEDFPHTSGSFETEDISEEVQRRLRIKEERRRRKDDAKPEKRKRESMVSNESMSPGNTQHRKKRVRTGHGLKRDGEIMTETKTRSQKKTRH
jgi:hypothetical protein